MRFGLEGTFLVNSKATFPTVFTNKCPGVPTQLQHLFDTVPRPRQRDSQECLASIFLIHVVETNKHAEAATAVR